MKMSPFTDSQIISILNQAQAGTPVPELCPERGISTATFYNWRSRYGGMDVSLMSKLKELEAENRRNRGFGRCFLFLRNVKGFHWNHKRVYRIYRELELNLRIKPKKRLKRPILANWQYRKVSTTCGPWTFVNGGITTPDRHV